MALLDEISGIVYSAVNAVGGTTWDVTLSKRGAATKDAYGTVTRGADTDYTGRGFLDDYSDAARALGGIPIADRKAILFDASFTSGIDPAPGDTLTMEGVDYTVIRAERDPASAAWTVQIRK